MGLVARKPNFVVCEQQKCRPGCASAQTDLISMFVVHSLESIIAKLAICKILIFQLVLVAQQAALSLTLSQTPNTGFLATRHLSIGTPSANSLESDLGSISRIYFDNVPLMLNNVMLTSQRQCQHNNKCDCSKTSSYKLSLYVFEKYIIFIYSVDLTFRVIRKIDFNRAKPTCYRTNFPYASSG